MPKTNRKPFVDFRAIREKLTMEQVLAHYGVLDTFKRTGTRLSGPCPIHGGSNPTQFRVDTERNLWNCFSECKNGCNVLDFIARKEDISINEAAIKACDWFKIAVPETKSGTPSNDPEPNSTPPAKTASAVNAPVREELGPNQPLKFRLEKLDRAHPYLAERGIAPETVIDFGLGYFTGENGLMTGRIVIPIHNIKGEVVAYVGRWPGEPPDKETPKYKLPTGFRKGQEVFNLDRAAKEPGPLVIVEGFFDAIKLHQNGCKKVVALMGSSLSPAQEESIRQHTTAKSQVIVMLDEDEAGQAGRDDIALRLSKFCFVKIHRFDEPGQQPEHLSREQVQTILEGLL